MASQFSSKDITAAAFADDETTENTTIIIDGSRGEGGGQILRNAIAFATIFFPNKSQPGKDARSPRLCIQNIRAGRSRPGLRAQHLTGIQLAVDIAGGGGALRGGSINSTEISYKVVRTTPPLPYAAGTGPTYRHFTGDIGTAGSIVLLLQAALPTALFAASTTSSASCTRLKLKGGTNAAMAPQFDYWERVFWPTLREQCGLAADQVQALVTKRGFYPRGGGQVDVTIQPLQDGPLQPIQLNRDRGDVATFYIRSFHAGKNLPRHLAEQMAKSAQSTLLAQYPHVPIETDIVTEQNAIGNGLGILVTATTTTGLRLAGSALGHPKTMTAQQAGVAAAQELLQTLRDGGCVDEWLQDQLILFMALAEGTSEMLTGSLTLHTRTAIWIAEEMTAAYCGDNGGAKFEVVHLESSSPVPTGIPETAVDMAQCRSYYGKDGRIAGRHLIRCHGIGYLPQVQFDGHRDKIHRCS